MHVQCQGGGYLSDLGALLDAVQCSTRVYKETPNACEPDDRVVWKLGDGVLQLAECLISQPAYKLASQLRDSYK